MRSLASVGIVVALGLGFTGVAHADGIDMKTVSARVAASGKPLTELYELVDSGDQSLVVRCRKITVVGCEVARIGAGGNVVESIAVADVHPNAKAAPEAKAAAKAWQLAANAMVGDAKLRRARPLPKDIDVRRSSTDVRGRTLLIERDSTEQTRVLYPPEPGMVLGLQLFGGQLADGSLLIVADWVMPPPQPPVDAPAQPAAPANTKPPAPAGAASPAAKPAPEASVVRAQTPTILADAEKTVAEPSKPTGPPRPDARIANAAKPDPKADAKADPKLKPAEPSAPALPAFTFPIPLAVIRVR